MEVIVDAISTRVRSGLTRNEVARLLGTTREDLQRREAGELGDQQLEARLHALADVITFVDRGFADVTATALRTQSVEGGCALDWLTDGRYDDVKRLLGKGRGPVSEEPTLSADERERRRPPAWVTLLDARHDVAHLPSGISRVVGRVRALNHDSVAAEQSSASRSK